MTVNVFVVNTRVVNSLNDAITYGSYGPDNVVVFRQTITIQAPAQNLITFRQNVILTESAITSNLITFRQQVLFYKPSYNAIVFRQRVFDE